MERAAVARVAVAREAVAMAVVVMAAVAREAVVRAPRLFAFGRFMRLPSKVRTKHLI
jgi:hypothetical protein